VVMIVLAEINLHPINLRLRLGHALLEIKIRKERGLSVGCRRGDDHSGLDTVFSLVPRSRCQSRVSRSCLNFSPSLRPYAMNRIPVLVALVTLE
jgi:hypothetical protein